MADNKAWVNEGKLNEAVSKCLTKPETHTEETLVGVDTTGGQEQVKIDANTLEITNGTLKAKIPAQTHLYEHNILISSDNIRLLISVINNSNVQLSLDNIRDIFVNSYSKVCSGYYIKQDIYYTIYSASVLATQISILGLTASGAGVHVLSGQESITDTIRQII